MTKTCVICQQVFEVTRHSKHRMSCSARCRSALARKRWEERFPKDKLFRKKGAA